MGPKLLFDSLTVAAFMLQLGMAKALVVTDGILDCNLMQLRLCLFLGVLFKVEI